VGLVANPAAGNGRGRRLAERLEAELQALGAAVFRRDTGGPGQATPLARALLGHGMDVIAACGGDGTVHEVVQVLAGTSCPVAVAPGGRGNDLARALGVPADPACLARMILAGATRRLDLGKAGPRCFASVATLGFDAAVSARAAQGIWGLRGRSAYVAAVVLALARFRAPAVEIRGARDAFSGRILLAATANTALYGGGMHIAPGALPDDGLFRVCLIREVDRLSVLRLLPLVIAGRHVEHPAVEFWDTPFLEIQANPSCDLYADGERLGRTPIRLDVVPSALWVVVPPSDDRL
jgi:diacylglycerol kinase (ATP)